MAFGKGKKNNVTATQPKKRRTAASAEKSEQAELQRGRGRSAHRRKNVVASNTSAVRESGPRKMARGTTTRSGDK